MTYGAQWPVEKMDVSVSEDDINWHAEYPSAHTWPCIVHDCYLYFLKANTLYLQATFVK